MNNPSKKLSTHYCSAILRYGESKKSRQATSGDDFLQIEANLHRSVSKNFASTENYDKISVGGGQKNVRIDVFRLMITT